MTTGTFESWTGDLLQIGPLYPFVGWEVLFWVVGMALWILWHVWQARNEANEYHEERERYARGDKLLRAIRGERIS